MYHIDTPNHMIENCSFIDLVYRLRFVVESGPLAARHCASFICPVNTLGGGVKTRVVEVRTGVSMQIQSLNG